MKVLTFKTVQELGAAAAKHGGEAIKQAIAEKGFANIILATGTSQFETLKHLVALPDIDWSKITAFHLDEYIGLSETHPASFRKYLKERFVVNVPTLKVFHFVEGDREDPDEECVRLDTLIQNHPIDVAFVGIGENGHLAFNDPPADFDTELGNGSHSVIPRLKNYIWEQLAADELMAGMICDGFHLPPSVVKVITRAKGLDRLILVSDVALLGGFEPGIYKWGNLDVQVFEDGHLGLPGTGFLAGAAHLLDWDIAHFINFTSYNLASTIPLCTTNLAKLLKLAENFGKLEVGAPANLVLFTFQPGEKRLNILKTIRAGKEIFVKS